MKPIYRHIAEKIEQEIGENIFLQGKLPSERELAEIYQVSRMTIRQSLKILEEKDLIYKEKGRGAFVKRPSFEQNNVKSFTETLAILGYEAKTKILEFSTVHSLETISQEMGLPLEACFYKIKRLRFGNELPMALETIYIPKEKVPDLNQYNLEESLYSILEEKYKKKIEKVSYLIEATLANSYCTKWMELSKPTALLKVKGVSYGNQGEKILYEESYYRTEIYKYHVDIHGKS